MRTSERTRGGRVGLVERVSGVSCCREVGRGVCGVVLSAGCGCVALLRLVVLLNRSESSAPACRACEVAVLRILPLLVFSTVFCAQRAEDHSYN